MDGTQPRLPRFLPPLDGEVAATARGFTSMTGLGPLLWWPTA
jgi:hypothetical protein